jgi:hypothetical protein
MATDYAGHYYAPGSVDNLRSAMFLLKIRSSINVNDFTAFNGDCIALKNSTFTIHRNEDAVPYE